MVYCFQSLIQYYYGQNDWLVGLVYGVYCHFQQYFSYIVAVSLIGGGT
jgi:hypothetical protein